MLSYDTQMKKLFTSTFIAFTLLSATTTAYANFKSCFEMVNRLMSPEVFYGEGASVFSKALTVKELEQLYGHESFFSIQSRLDSSEITQHNKNLLKVLKKNPEFKNAQQNVTEVSKKQASDLYKAMKKSNVYENEICYTRPDVTVGYCFGRAVVVHTEAILRGVDPGAIKKIWVVGDLGHWGHHVATMVRGSNEKWYVIDEVTGVVTVEDWISALSTMKKRGAKTPMFFVSQAERVGPYNAQTYNMMDLFNTNTARFKRSSDYYLGYFRDYFDWLDTREPVEKF